MAENRNSQQQVQKNSNAGAGYSAQQNKVKKGKKVSIKGFLIGCGVFGLVMILLIAFGLYNAVQSPGAFESLGLEKQDIKNLLMIFTVLFFGIIFFVSFSVLLLNGYRRATTKGSALSKMKYGLGSFTGFIFLAFAIGGGAVSIIQVNQMGGVNRINTSGIVSPFLITKNNPSGEFVSFGDNDKSVLAPSYFVFRLNKNNFNQRVTSNIRGDFKRVELDCGNGKVLESGPSILGNNSYFGERCFFREKKNYDIKLTYFYVNDANKTLKEEIDVGSLNIDAKVDINSGNYSLNDPGTSIVLGNAPVNLNVDASEVFADLEIRGKEIKWDFNGSLDSGELDFDRENAATAQRTYKSQNNYKLFVNIPALERTYLIANIVVGPRNVPFCSLDAEKRGGSKYLFSSSFDKQVDIKNYKFSVIDNATQEIIDSESKNVGTFEYGFSNGGKYKVKMDFTTDEDRKGSCESDVIDVSSGNYRILYDVFVKNPSGDEFEEQELTGDALVIKKLPSEVRVEVDKILPKEDSAEITFLDENGNEISPVDDRTYKFSVKKEEEKEYTFRVEDSKGRETTQTLPIKVKQQELIAKLKVEPQSGESPLDVTLDASVSELNDEDDEIIYFTWNFGDGERLSNVSQGRLTHTYQFDKDDSNGVFHPEVEVETRDGLTDSATERVTITRKQRKAELNVESHPTQRVQPRDTVRLSLSTSGQIENIEWDFGNGKTISGEGRQYTEVSTSYEEKGEYTIEAVINYEEYPSITKTINIKVE